MVIIRINGSIEPQRAQIIIEGIHNQARTGIIVVPHFCELLNEVPADEEIKVVHEDARVAALEKELAIALQYIKERKECGSCLHAAHAIGCLESYEVDCIDCHKQTCNCKTCTEGSNWKWRGANGTK